MNTPLKTDRPCLFALIGIPASGKTTLARQIEEIYAADHISSDDIRESKFGCRFSREIRDHVFDEMIKTASAALRRSRNVIIDTTYLNTRAMREIFLQRIRKDDLLFLSMAVCFCSASAESCITFDSRRRVGRRVGKDIILAHAREIEYPSILEDIDIIVSDSAFRRIYIRDM